MPPVLSGGIARSKRGLELLPSSSLRPVLATDAGNHSQDGGALSSTQAPESGEPQFGVTGGGGGDSVCMLPVDTPAVQPAGASQCEGLPASAGPCSQEEHIFDFGIPPQ